MAIVKNDQSYVVLIALDKLIHLRMPLRTPWSDFELMVEETEEGVKEESRVRR
jgi:hypothetical protein